MTTWPDALPPLAVTPSLSDIVQMSLATRDFHPVHHDPATARALGHPAPFLNIMGTSALVERFVRQAFGPGVQLRSLSLRLGVPHHAGQTLTFEGRVSACDPAAGTGEVTFTATNALGRHAHGAVQVALQP
jgi:acyl dehydratase